MREIYAHSRFRKDVKRIRRRGLPLVELETVIDMLATDETLPARYRDHALTGNFTGLRECHIRPDWLLIYRLHEDQLILSLRHACRRQPQTAFRASSCAQAAHRNARTSGTGQNNLCHKDG